MSDTKTWSTKTWKRYGGAAGLVAGGLVAGGVLAGTFTASAAEDTTTGPESSTSQSAEDPARPERGSEELLTGDVKTQVEEAVLAEYPGATIERSETDSGGVYEAHITTADDEELTVELDDSFTVTGTENR